MTSEDRPFAITPRVIVGLLIVCFGLALTLDNLELIRAGNIIRYWPFGLIAIGLAKLLQDRERSSRTAGVLFIVIGGLFAMEEFLYIEVDVWRWWPLVIVFFGVLILARALRGASEPRPKPSMMPPGTSGVRVASASTTTGGAEQTFSEVAIWSGVKRRVSSPAFRRADLTAVMGGIELDLRQAGTEGGEAVVDVFVLWGGIEITVPPDWSVSNQVTPILGGAEDRSTGTQQARHRLTVKGVVIMGGVDIKI